ncbi:hypothetical protein [Demequina pelophila]|uniref:hypothetical protein n=1 Tax=Demequina pelophila TaxID=1638984 RepID=UPI000781A008|nr:hypothetical protein [Demequina pelophila]
MRSLVIKGRRVAVVRPGRRPWLVFGAVLHVLFAVVAIPLTIRELHYTGTIAGLVPLYVLGTVLLAPGTIVMLTLGRAKVATVIALLLDEETDDGVRLAVVDARRELAEFVVGPEVAGRCRVLLGAPPAIERG